MSYFDEALNDFEKSNWISRLAHFRNSSLNQVAAVEQMSLHLSIGESQRKSCSSSPSFSGATFPRKNQLLLFSLASHQEMKSSEGRRRTRGEIARRSITFETVGIEIFSPYKSNSHVKRLITSAKLFVNTPVRTREIARCK